MGGAESVPTSVAELDAYVTRMRAKLAATEQLIEFLDFVTGESGALAQNRVERIDRWISLRAGMGLMPDWSRRLTGTRQPALIDRLFFERADRAKAKVVRWPMESCRASEWRWSERADLGRPVRQAWPGGAPDTTAHLPLALTRRSRSWETRPFASFLFRVRRRRDMRLSGLPTTFWISALSLAFACVATSCDASTVEPGDDASTTPDAAPSDAAALVDAASAVDAASPVDSSAPPDARGPADTSLPDAGPPDTGPSSCSDLALTLDVAGRRSGSTISTPVGGTIADSTLHLFDVTRYGATSGTLGTFQGALRFSGATYELRLLTPTGPIESAGTFVVSGTTMALTATCTIGSFPRSVGYDASIPLYVRLYDGTTVYSFTGT